jgi:L-iditol 2-dehydrogenase
MHIAVLCAPRQFDVIDAPIPQSEDDEVLVRVAYCGVCTSELDMWEGKAGDDSFPRFPGHEVSGIVEQAGAEVRSLQPGDPVAVWVTGRGFAQYLPTARVRL